MATPRNGRWRGIDGDARADHRNRAYRRILVKLSGEALLGTTDFGIDPAVLKRIASEILESPAHGRAGRRGHRRRQHLPRRGPRPGRHGPRHRRSHGHAGHGHQCAGHAGRHREPGRAMRASCPRSASTRSARTTSAAAPCGTSKRAAIVIFAAGTGNPFFTTDTRREPARHRDRRRHAAQGDQGQRHLRLPIR